VEIGAFHDIESSKFNFGELKSKGYVRYEDLPLETSNGKTISVEFVSNVYSVDHTSVAQCNIRDIRARKFSESAFQKLRTELETFSYSLSHELSVPLRQIMGFTKSLRENCADKMSADCLQLIQNIHVSVQGMNDLIDSRLQLIPSSGAEVSQAPKFFSQPSIDSQAEKS
jgi:signal transduction histidine kinase